MKSGVLFFLLIALSTTVSATTFVNHLISTVLNSGNSVRIPPKIINGRAVYLVDGFEYPLKHTLVKAYWGKTLLGESSTGLNGEFTFVHPSAEGEFTFVIERKNSKCQKTLSFENKDKIDVRLVCEEIAQ